MGKHLEDVFETELVQDLVQNGWLLGEAKGYDKDLALYPEDVWGWLEDTQPKELAKVRAREGAGARDSILKVLTAELDRHGALHVLRRGFKNVSAKFDMCQFKPSHGLNPEILERYVKVRCRVVRQVHYSTSNENSIDLVLFVNGIPVATLELKTDFTQSIQEAIEQYKNDRPPKDPTTKREEPLLMFKRRALVHFALSTDEVYMTTHLRGSKTVFLPFNRGHNFGAGNPPPPITGGYRTSYLWEEVLQRDSWLNILGAFMHLERKIEEDEDGNKITKESLIFPRYHQWQAVNRLIETSRLEGSGQRYLIQHSAGSGKSNSIAWLAHRLASLHDAQDGKIFDSVIVITDRTVLDQQLQETIYQFEHKDGVVVPIKNNVSASKTEQFTAALLDKAPIIVMTLQTFPAFLKFLRELSALKTPQDIEQYFKDNQGKKRRTQAQIAALLRLQTNRYAIIADEAHSSQSGDSAGDVARVLATGELDEEVDAEDLMLAEMEARAEHPNISFYAFTATPKGKTLMRFGRPLKPNLPISDDNKPEAFHVYSMQQAIEEGFIRDVLKQYTTYKMAFRLTHNGKDYDDKQVEEIKALRGLMRWVRLHPYNIAQKVQIIVEHFRENVAPLLEGKAKAMVVTASRKEAVRYKLAMDKYIQQQNYTDLATLVAFSGDVIDPESGPEKFNEHNMNPGLKGRDIRDAFKTGEYQVLIVANKFQTGFDQPLLCAMYVDKKLSGITAVQTLSRLNRTYPGKEDSSVFVLDFVNEAEDILAAFKPYYRTAELNNVTDPNLIHALQNKLDAERVWLDSELDGFARAVLDPRAKQSQMQAFIAPAVDRFKVRWKEAIEAGDKKRLDELEVFKKDLQSFVRLYDFLSQIINYADTDLEKRALFCRFLARRLEVAEGGDGIDLSAVSLSHYRLRHQGEQKLKLSQGEEDKLSAPGDVGSGVGRDPKKALLSQIVQKMNDLFQGAELTEADYVGYVYHLRDKMLENEILAGQARTNTLEQFKLGDFDTEMKKTIVSSLENYQSMAKQVFSSEKVYKGLADILLKLVYESFQEHRT